MIGRNGRWTVLVGVVAASLAAAGCSDSEASEESVIQTIEVSRGDLRITAEATGSVEPIRTIEVKSKAGGEILELHAEIGDQVDTGALLAEIDPRDVRNSYDQTEADLEVARVRAEIAEQQLERQRNLFERGIITEQEFETARESHTNAQASLIRAEANLELAELRLADVTIRAPMNGTILSRQVEEGSVIQSASGNVSGGTPLFLMADLSEMQVRTLVDETDMGEIQAGMAATVSIEAYPDRSFMGEVQKIEPQAVVQSNVTMFPVIVTLDNRNRLLKPGMNAEVEIEIDEARDVLTVPNGAVVNLQDVSAAAMALGVDLDQFDLSLFRSAGRFGGARASGQGAGNGEGDAPGADSTAGGAAVDAGQGRAAGERGMDPERLQQMRESMSPEQRERLREAMASRAAGSGGVEGGMGQGQRQTRRAVVFVAHEDATLEPRVVELGLSDWDSAEVVSGLEEGDVLAVVATAQLIQRQQESLERMRDRMGGGMLGGR